MKYKKLMKEALDEGTVETFHLVYRSGADYWLCLCRDPVAKKFEHNLVYCFRTRAPPRHRTPPSQSP